MAVGVDTVQRLLGADLGVPGELGHRGRQPAVVAADWDVSDHLLDKVVRLLDLQVAATARAVFLHLDAVFGTVPAE